MYYSKGVRINYILFWAFFILVVDGALSPSLSFARRIKYINPGVVKWDEGRSRALTQKVAQELGLTKLEPETLALALALQHPNSVSFGKDWYLYENYVDKNKIELVRLGYLFFIDSDKYSQLSPELKQDLGANVILVKNLSNSILTDLYGKAHYTLTTIAAMLNVDLRGKRIIDCGAGEGILSIVAKKLGAKFLDLVEIKKDELNRARANLELNGIEEGKDFNLICEDLNNVDEVVSQLSKTDLETVVISNIGTWPGSYPGVSNQTSMQLLSLVPQARMFIAGGYNSATFRNLNIIRRDKKAVGKFGFRVNRQEAEFGMMPEFIAWVAIRNQ